MSFPFKICSAFDSFSVKVPRYIVCALQGCFERGDEVLAKFGKICLKILQNLTKSQNSVSIVGTCRFQIAFTLLFPVQSLAGFCTWPG